MEKINALESQKDKSSDQAVKEVKCQSANKCNDLSTMEAMEYEHSVFPIHDLRQVINTAAWILKSVNAMMDFTYEHSTAQDFQSKPREEEGENEESVTSIKEGLVQVVEQVPVHNANNEEAVFERSLAVNRLPSLFYIKSVNDQVEPVQSAKLFQEPKEQNQQLTNANQAYLQQIENALESVPPLRRQQHFTAVDKFQGIPTLMNHEFKTNLIDMDSARLYETLAASNDIIWPVPFEKTISERVPYNVLFLCPPSGGAVTGTKMYLDLTRPDLEVKWTAFTKYPWNEGIDLDKVVVNDNPLFWERHNWKFVLNQDMCISSRREVEILASEVKVDFGREKVDLVVADLSPHLVDMDDSFNGLGMSASLRKALLTEAGEIILALRTLNDEGSFILSLINPVDDLSTNGNIGLICGLFSVVALVTVRPSSTWMRPVMLVCSGYKGYDTFQKTYPNFEDFYLSSISDNGVTGNLVVMNTADMPLSVVDGLVKFGRSWAGQEKLRLNSLTAAYRRNNIFRSELVHHQFRDAQVWLDTITSYVNHISTEWNVFLQVIQSCDPDVLGILKMLWNTEKDLSTEIMEFSLIRLRGPYMSDVVPFPDLMNVHFNDVQASKLDEIKKEMIPSTMSFSRFTSLQIIYDFMTARRIGSFFPVEDYAREVESGIPDSCTSHLKPNIRKALASDGFQITIKDDHLVIACVKISTASRLTMSEDVFHQKVIETLLSKFSCAKVLDKNDSLFVCQMPLTTRILLGSVCIINKCFKKTSLVVFKEERMIGILFQHFNGHRDKSVQWMKSRLTHLLEELKQNREVDMGFVPLESLFNCVDLPSLLQYNNAVIAKATGSIVNVLIGSLTENSEVGYVH